MLALPDDADAAPKIALDELNFGLLPDGERPDRGWQRRFYDEAGAARRRRAPRSAQPLDADAALALGLVTAAPDDIDWDDEIRIALEERAAMSPDALTGMEANLRFGGAREHGDAHLRPPVRVAELDLPAPERRRREGRAQGLRHRREGRLRLEPRLNAHAHLIEDIT